MNGWKSYLGVALMSILKSLFEVEVLPEFWYNMMLPAAQGLLATGLIHKAVKFKEKV